MNNEPTPAFPQNFDSNNDPHAAFADDRGGMTLRDYFAGQALVGLSVDEHTSVSKAAHLAYEYADAMLEARKQ